MHFIDLLYIYRGLNEFINFADVRKYQTQLKLNLYCSAGSVRENVAKAVAAKKKDNDSENRKKNNK